MSKSKSGFEKALGELKKYAEKIKKEDLSLDESIECYEKGMEEYKKCRAFLDEAKQKIQIFGEEEA